MKCLDVRTVLLHSCLLVMLKDNFMLLRFLSRGQKWEKCWVYMRERISLFIIEAGYRLCLWMNKRGSFLLFLPSSVLDDWHFRAMFIRPVTEIPCQDFGGFRRLKEVQSEKMHKRTIYFAEAGATTDPWKYLQRVWAKRLSEIDACSLWQGRSGSASRTVLGHRSVSVHNSWESMRLVSSWLIFFLRYSFRWIVATS